ncbi:MAG: hypothetical protein ACI4V4_02025 [Eubacterium sp.]
MKKSVVLLLAVLLLVSFIFAACTAKNNETNADGSTTALENGNDLESEDTEYGFETEAVTDENGEQVTDDKGNTVTNDVAVVYKKDSNGKVYAQKLDADGNGVTKDDGAPVTLKSNYVDELNKNIENNNSQSSNSESSNSEDSTVVSNKTTTTSKDSSSETVKNTTSTTKNNTTSTTKISTTSTTKNNTTTKPSTTEDKTTATTKKNVELTKDASTTKFDGKEVVPKTSQQGEEVNFSKADQEIISSMLEVPYLYLSNYENSDGVPVKTAVYTAVWMAQRDGGTGTGKDAPYASNPIILNLFKFYGNTVVNFKTKCNNISDTPISYVSSKDQFVINEFPEKQQSVTITKIEDLGNNNFYKITGSVTNAGSIKKVIAIVQKNRLEPTLGFSIKALEWS